MRNALRCGSSARIARFWAVFLPLTWASLAGAGEIWDGEGADSNWTTGLNWNPIFNPLFPFTQFPPPNNGTANIHFAGNDNTVPNVDIPYSINSLTFDAGSLSFFITGQELTIGAGGVTNNDNSAQVILAPVRLAADQTWTAAGAFLQANGINLNGFDLTFGGAFNTTLNGPISGSGALRLPSTYTSTVTISGFSSNTYTGYTYVDGGTLILSKSGGDVAIPGSMIIGQSGGPSATVRLMANEQIAHGANYGVDVRGILDLNGFNETVDRLIITGPSATVTTGSGRLIVARSISSTFAGSVQTITGNVDLNAGIPDIIASGRLVFDGVISNGGVNIIGDDVEFKGAAANTYTGPTIANLDLNRALFLNKSAVDGAIRGDLTVTGILELLRDEQILAAPGNELVLDSGRFAMNGHSETVQDLTLKFADIVGGGGTLTVLGTLKTLPAGLSSTIGANINLQGSRVFDIASGATIDLSVSGVMSNGALVKDGPGILRLSGPNTYTGGTFLNQGVVDVSADSPLGGAAGGLHFNGGTLRVSGGVFASTSRTITLGPNGGTFEINNATFTVGTQSLTGSGPLTKLGPGKLVLLAPQSYTGGTTVAAGTLEGNTQSLQGNIVNNATLAFNQTGNGTYAGNLSGTGVLSKLGAGGLRLAGINTYSGTTAINAGTLELAGGSAIGDFSAVTLANAAGVLLDLADSSETLGSLAGGGINGGNVDLGTGALTTGGDNSSTTFAGAIGGAGGIVKTGSGVFTLTGVNTYAGGTTFAGGVLSAGSDAHLGDVVGPLRFDGGTLRVTGAFNTTPRLVELLAGGGGLDIANAANSFTYLGNVTGVGALTKLGTGTLVLSGINAYGGATTINAGTLRTVGGNALPDGSAIALADVLGGVLDLAGGNETIGSLAGGGPSGGNVMLGGAVLTTGGDNTSTTYGGSISGAGAVVKTGTGLFTLNGINAYSGLTDVQAGALRLGSLTGLPNDNAVHVAAGATFDLNGFDKTLSALTGTGQVTLGVAELALGAADAASNFGGGIAGSGRLLKFGAGAVTLDGANSYTGGTTVLAGRLRGTTGGLQGNIVNHAIVEFAQASDGAYSGALSGPGSLVKTGPGRVTIAMPATYTGTTTVFEGTLHVPNTLNVPGGAILIEANGTLEASGIIQRAIAGAGALVATGNLVAGDLTSASGFDLGAVHVGSHAVVLLDADQARLGGGTIAGGSLTTLAGAQLSGGTFAGHGTINAGFINNGLVAGPDAPLAMTFAGPLSGAGAFAGNIRILDSFSPGNSPAAVAFGGDVAYGGHSSLHIELGGLVPGTQHDQINVAGSLMLGGTLALSLMNAFVPTVGDKFTIATYGSRSGTFGTINGQMPAPGIVLSEVYRPNDLILLTTAPGEKTWGVDASGNASLGANWIGGVAPGGIGDAAAFTAIITAPRVVTIDAPLTLGTLRFDDDNNYTLAGPNTIALQNAGANHAAINVLNLHGNGQHTITAPVFVASDLDIAQNSASELTISGGLATTAGRSITKTGAGTVSISGLQSYGVGASITHAAGTLKLLSDAGAGGANLTLAARSTTNFTSRQHLAALDIGENVTSTLAVGGGTALVTNGLVVDTGAQLDLTDNDFVLRSMPANRLANAAAIEQLVAGGFAAFAWNGSGIASSAAAGDPNLLTALGVMLNDDGFGGPFRTTFSGEAVDANSILVKYTYYGDADLSGSVDGTDYALIDNGFNSGLSGWFNGDFDYSGHVDGTDYALIDNAFNSQTGPLGGLANVPEPGTLVLFLLGAAAFASQVLHRKRGTATAWLRV